MKIVFLAGRPLPSPTALWRRIGFFARYFQERGHDVRVVGVFSLKDLGEAPGRYARYGRAHRNGVKIINVDTFSSLGLLVPLLVLLRPDVVVTSVPPGRPIPFAYLAAKILETKLVIDYRDEWEDYMLGRSTSRTVRSLLSRLKSWMTQLYRESDWVVTVTANLVDNLRARGLDRVGLVPNGVDLRVFRPHARTATRERLGLGADDIALIHSGTIGEYYRLDIVIRAIARLPEKLRRRVKLVLAGRGGNLPSLKALAQRVGLPDTILHLGVLNDTARLAEVLSAADLGLVPHDASPLWKNALPAKFFEYSACGLPTLANAFEDSMLATLMKERDLGEATPPLDEKRLSERIAALARDTNRRKRLGENARRTMAALFDRRAITEEFLRDVSALVENTGQPS
ncbi:MAG: glycosyltransferase family 4 protein [Thermoplasmata archaeon]